jgi:hypothetical protein
MVRCGMQPQSPTVPDAESFADRRATFRTAFVDGREAMLVDRDRLLPVRILDESTGGFRVTSGETCALPDQTRTLLHLEEREIPVRIIYKRVEGPRTMLGLQRLPS